MHNDWKGLMKGEWLRMSFVAMVVFVALMSSPAMAAEDGSESLAARGTELRKQGRDQEALPLFLEALKADPSPKSLAQAGLCEQAMGLWVTAEQHLLQALALPSEPWIKRNEPAIREALAFIQKRLGDIEVWGTPAGATIHIDGATVAKLPTTAPLRVGVGRRIIAVDAPGFVGEFRTIDVRQGDHLREHVVLVPAALPRAQEPESHPGNGEGAPLGATLSQAPLASPVSDDNSSAGPVYTRWWFWTAVGAVVVAGGVSAYLIFGRNENCSAAMGATCGKW